MKKGLVILFIVLFGFITIGCNDDDSNGDRCQDNPELEECQDDQIRDGLVYTPVDGFEDFNLEKVSVDQSILTSLESYNQLDNIQTIIYYDYDTLVYFGNDNSFHTMIDGELTSKNLLDLDHDESYAYHILGYNPETTEIYFSNSPLYVGDDAVRITSMSFDDETRGGLSESYNHLSKVLAISNYGLVIENGDDIDVYSADYTLLKTVDKNAYLGYSSYLDETNNQYYLFTDTDASSCTIEVYNNSGHIKDIAINSPCSIGVPFDTHSEDIYFLLGEEYYPSDLYRFDIETHEVTQVSLNGNKIKYINEQDPFIELYKFTLDTNNDVCVNETLDFDNYHPDCRNVEALGETFYVEYDSFNEQKKSVYDLNGILLKEYYINRTSYADEDYLSIPYTDRLYWIVYDVYHNGVTLLIDNVIDFTKLGDNAAVYKDNITNTSFDITYHNLDTNQTSRLKRYSELHTVVDFYSIRILEFSNGAFGILDNNNNEVMLYDASGSLLKTYTLLGDYYGTQVLLLDDNNELLSLNIK